MCKKCFVFFVIEWQSDALYHIYLHVVFTCQETLLHLYSCSMSTTFASGGSQSVLRMFWEYLDLWSNHKKKKTLFNARRRGGHRISPVTSVYTPVLSSALRSENDFSFSVPVLIFLLLFNQGDSMELETWCLEMNEKWVDFVSFVFFLSLKDWILQHRDVCCVSLSHSL